MTRFRFYSTLLVLATGTAMGASYFDPGSPIAPEAMDTQKFQPEIKQDKPQAAIRGNMPSDAAVMEAAPVTPPTVALPTGPLLRSATTAPPIDTSVTSLSPATVRHLADEDGMTIRALPEDQPQSLGQTAATKQVTAPSTVGRPSPRRAKPRPPQVRHSRRVEQLFLNPLGTR